MAFTTLIHEVSRAIAKEEIATFTEASFHACAVHCINSFTKDEKQNIEMIHNLTCEYQKNIFKFISSFYYMFTADELRAIKSNTKSERYKTANKLIKALKDGDFII